MNKKLLNTLLLIIVLLVISIFMIPREGFGATSPGTMVQLNTSHVPTEEDEDYVRNIYPKIVQREIARMTE
jgi:hypothetical protein